MNPLNILVVGTGMYSCGRGTDEYGTILPALFEWKKRGELGDVYVAGKSAEGIAVAKEKIDSLKQDMNIEMCVRYFPEKGLKQARSYKEAIRAIPKPACAMVVVPDHLHREIAGCAIEGGLHTLVVKPIAPTLKEARELINLRERHNVYGAVEFHKRFDYANMKLKDAVESGLIGDPLYFLAQYSQRKSVPSERFRKWISTTNIFQYLGIHYIDIIYLVTRALPRRVMGIGQKGWLVSKGINTYDAIQGIIEWEMPGGKRFTSHIITNWIDPENTSAMSDQKIKVIGTKGRYESDQKKRGITIISDEKGIEEPNPYFSSAYGMRGDMFYHGYGIESIHQFLDDVIQIEEGAVKIDELEGKRPTFEQSIVPTAIIEGVNISLKKNSKWIPIKGI